MIEFTDDIEWPAMTPERQAAIDYVVKHWRVTDDGGLRWQKCSPECEHQPPASEGEGK